MSGPLWTVDAMVAAMRAERAGALPDAIGGISIDIRSVAPGEGFFAIKGDTHDGHGFVATALENGAGLAVVARDKLGDICGGLPKDAPLLVVPDVLAGLGDLATARVLVCRARKAGARTALITAQPEAPLAAQVDVVTIIPAQTMADDRVTNSSILPMGSLFETAQMVFFEMVVLKLRPLLNESIETMRARHTNLE